MNQLLQLIKKTLGFGFVVATIGIISCKNVKIIPIDKKSIVEFHQRDFEAVEKLSDSVDLYIDYSTCVSEAVHSSEFFKQIRPRITGLNPSLYGIKGNDIIKISDNNDFVNQELNNVKEIPFANIQGSCQQICNGIHQAILVTDGEYWTDGIGERINLAYMKDSFIKWISKGFEIYMYVENYRENYKGRNYDKKRFYLLFTDDKLSDNIFKELNKAFGAQSQLNELKLIKISNKDVIINDRISLNAELDSRLINNDSFNAYEVFNDWKSLDEFILNAKKPEDGSTIPGGAYLLRGLKITSDPISAYKYSDLDLRVYNVSMDYLSNDKTDFSNEIKDVFILDNELFRQTGEVGIKMSELYANSLSDKTENLFRIDIVAKKTEKNIFRNDVEWGSLSQPGNNNSSMFESIIQTIDNPKIDPSVIHNPLYTIYLKTSSY